MTATLAGAIVGEPFLAEANHFNLNFSTSISGALGMNETGLAFTSPRKNSPVYYLEERLRFFVTGARF